MQSGIANFKLSFLCIFMIIKYYINSAILLWGKINLPNIICSQFRNELEKRNQKMKFLKKQFMNEK